MSLSPFLLQAASTGPFFHNNVVNTIEEAVAFYNSDAFAESPAGDASGGIQLTDTQVAAVAAFLRVIGALEKVRSATELLNKVLEERALSDARESLSISKAEIGHGIRVLHEVKLHGAAVGRLRVARELLSAAAKSNSALLEISS
ncbi:MAG TPA: hypothetical protein VGR30_19630 [Candidatus Binatia bacterium]|nr:hypothetical protein [Candidatus Binatia bacterium]